MQKIKLMLGGVILLQSATFASVTVEKGYSGVEFETNMTIINSTNKLNNPLFSKYSLIQANNNYISRTLEEDNTDRENIYKLGYTYSNIIKNKGNGINLMYSYSPEADTRIGINANYTRLDNNYSYFKGKGNFGQLNIFYNQKDYQNLAEVFSTLYLGLSNEKDKNKDVKIDNKFIGLYNKYSVTIPNDYYNFFPKVYVEADLKRIELKEKKNDIRTKNDSINIGIGANLEKIIYENDLKISIIPNIAYNHEFLDKRKYKGTQDIFKDDGKIGIEIKAEYKEITKGFIKYEYKKSFSNAEDMGVMSAGIKIML